MTKAANAVLALSRAFYGRRISAEQYSALASCKSANEIAAYLRANTDYAKELEASSISDFSPKALEDLVTKHRFARFDALCRYELAIGSELYKYFIIKTEVEQILRCTLLMFSKNKDTYLMQMNPFVDKHLNIDLFELGKANSLEEIAASLEKTQYGKLFRQCLESEQNNYLNFEMQFQGYFESSLRSLVERCAVGKRRKAIFDVIARSLDCKRLENMYRCLRYYNGCTTTVAAYIANSASITLFEQSTLKKLTLCKNENEFFSLLSKTAYKDWYSPQNETGFEKQLQLKLHAYCKKQIRFSSYPSVVMFCYMLLSHDEKLNLIKIIEGNKYGVPSDEVLKNIVV